MSEPRRRCSWRPPPDASARTLATLATLALATSCAFARDAHAGNADTFPLGNDAALLAGAATAATYGAAATWYNPARIAVGDEDDLDVAASGYLLRFGGTPDLQPAPNSGATRTKLASLDLTPVPTVVAYRRKVLGLDVGVGLFVPSATLAYPRTLLRSVPRDGSQPSEVAIDGNSRFSEYYAGLGIGRAILPNLRVGAALFGYYSSRIETELLGARQGSQGFIIDAGSRAQLQLGGQLVLGVDFRPKPGVELGFTLRTPVVQLFSQVQETTFRAEGGGEQAASRLSFDERPLGAAPSILVPLAAAIGTSLDLTRNTMISLDVKGRGILTSQVPEQRREPVFDLRAGLRRRFTDDLWIGGGVFTDRSGVPRAMGTATVLDFYGASMGIELGTPYRGTAEHETTPRILRFSTAIAVSYAVGIGSVGNVAVATRGSGLDLQFRQDDVIAHEIMLHVGSSLGITPTR